MMYTRAVPKPESREKQAKPLSRKAWIRRKDPRRLKKQSPADRRYLAFLHTQPCMGAECIPGHVCSGPIEASHYRDMTGLGLKSSDTTCIPLCQSLHRDYDQGRGYFAVPLSDRKLFHVSQQLKMKIRFELEELASIF